MIHLVWELLNSHATYLWSYDASATAHQMAIQKLEYVLGVIRQQGRQQYRMAIPTDLGAEGLLFQVIRHEKVSSTTTDSFPIWRHQLHQRLL
jgi:hypothetical protein